MKLTVFVNVLLCSENVSNIYTHMKRKRPNKPHNKPSTHWTLEYMGAKKALQSQFIGQGGAIERLAGIGATYLTGLRHASETWVAPRHCISGGVSSGKTSMIKALAQHLNVPFITINCGSIVADSWKGTSISDAMKQLIYKSSNEDRIYSHGAIIFFDEFLKLIKRGEKEEHLKTLVYNLLPLLGGESVFIEQDSFDGPIELKTNRILIFFADAFEGISPSNFSSTSKMLKLLLRLGYPREIVSRISGHTHISSLNKIETLKAIELEAEKRLSAFKMGKHYPSFKPSDSVKIALEVQKNKLGLRSAQGMIDELFFERAKKEHLRSLF